MLPQFCRLIRLLLVEDDPELRRMLAGLLIDEGYAVDEAPDGHRGLHLGLSRSYDLVVLDRCLPAVEGLDLLARLRTRGVTTPVLVLSALGRPVATGGGPGRRRRRLPRRNDALVRRTALRLGALAALGAAAITRAQLMRRTLRAGADPRLACDELVGLVEDAAALAEVLEDLLLAADPGAETGGAVVDLAEMARQVAASATPAAEARAIALSCTDGPAVAVFGSRAALRRAMTALMDNAIRHARSEVRLSVTVAGRRALVDVCDDGPGVDPEILPRLFERFASGLSEQGLPDNRRRYGIGLALVGEVAARHGGTVAAVASPGPGASIRLTLPPYTGSSKKTPRTAKDPSSDANPPSHLPEDFRGAVGSSREGANGDW